MPKVTTIIPAYNAMSYLPRTIDSVLAQTFRNFEIIVINDGSSDETEQWVSQLNDSRVRLINQTNQGVSAARNAGIAVAQGEYLAFLDADDLWEPTKLDKQVHCLDNQPEVGLVYTWTMLANQEGKPKGRIVSSDAQGDVWQQLIAFNFVGCGSTPLVRRICFETVGLFHADVTPAEDWDMWLRIAARYPFAVVKEPLVRYRANPNSASKSHLKMWQSSSKVIEKAFQSASNDLLFLKKQIYSSHYFYLSWLATGNGDCEQAHYFYQQAVAYNPRRRYSRESLRLSLAIILRQRLGTSVYKSLLELIYFVRQPLSRISRLTLTR